MAVILCLAALLVLSVAGVPNGGEAWANSAGYSGAYDIAASCSGGTCHTQEASVGFTYTGPTNLPVNQTGVFTVTITGGLASATVWGFDLAFTNSATTGGARSGALTSTDTNVLVVGGNQLEHAGSRSSRTVTFNWTAPAAVGTYRLWVSGVSANGNGNSNGDRANNNVAGFGVTVTADTQPPTSTISTPAVSGTLVGVTPYAILGSATDVATGNGIVTGVSVSTDNQATWNAATITSGAGTPSVTWSYSWADPVEDYISHTLWSRATDALGNTEIPAVSRQVFVDRVPPAVTGFVINSGANGTANPAVTLSYTVTDGSPSGGWQMRFSTNGGSTWSSWETYAAGKALTLPAPDGTKTVLGEFRDAALNTRQVSDTILLDQTAPTVQATSPTGGATGVLLTADLTATFDDQMTSGSITATTFELWLDGNTNGVIDAPDTQVTGAVTYDGPTKMATFNPTSALSYGTHYLARLTTGVQNIAGLGLLSAYSWAFTTESAPQTGVQVAVITPADGAVMRGTVSRVAGTATGNPAVVLVEVSTDGGSNWRQAVIDSAAGAPTVAWHFDWPLPANDNVDSYVVLARATDMVGAIGVTTFGPTVRIDNVPPAVGAFYVDDDAPSTSRPDVTLTIQAADGSPPLQMQFSNDGITWAAWQAYAGTVTWTLGSGQGNHTVHARLRDGLGNVTTRTIGDSIALDSAAPTVVRTKPPDGSIGVSPASLVQISFSAPMDPATITDENIQLWQDGDGLVPFDPSADSQTAAAVSYDADTSTALLEPDQPLNPGTRFYVRELTGVASAAGVHPATETVLTFVTGEVVAGQPTVALLSPPDGAQGVAVDADLLVLFDREMDLSSLQSGITLRATGSGRLVAGHIELDPSDARRVYFRPDGLLAISATYTFAVANTVRDYAGNALGSDITSNFVTGAGGLNPHNAFNAGSNACGTCHAVHGAAAPGGFGGPLLQRSNETDLCYTCHDGSGAPSNVQAVFASRVTGHVLEDVSGPSGAGMTSRCSSCHDLHALGTQQPSLYRKSIAGAAVIGDDYTWCEACHNDAFAWAGPTVAAPYPYPAGGTDPARPLRDATDGYPKAGTFPGATAYNDTSHNPHNPTTSANVVWPGTGYPSGDCRNCHAPHASASPRDALAATFRPTPDATSTAGDRQNGTYAELCLTCHDSDGPATKNVKQYVTFDSTLEGPQYTGGHRIATAGGVLPAGAPLPCYDCHNPHGSKGNDGTNPNSSLISDERWSNIDTLSTAGEVAFCLGCHLPWEYAAGSGRPEAGTVPTGQLPTVEGLNRTDPTNRLTLPKGMSAHGKANLDSPRLPCSDCHGKDHATAPTAAAGFNVHRPASGETSCVKCHDVPRQGLSVLRRAVLGVTGDFAGAGHHVTLGQITDADCGACHMERDAVSQKYSPDYHANGVIDLRDPDTGLALPSIDALSRNRTNSTIEPEVSVVQDGLCLKCHDADGAASPDSRVPGGTAQRPFSSGSTDAADVNSALDPGKAFHHAVRAAGASEYATPSLLNGFQVTMEPPWNQSAGTHDVVSCFDCHATTAGHGGANADSGITDFATAAGQRDLCLTCHKKAVYEDGAGGSRFGEHSRTEHLLSGGANTDGCRSCHAGRTNASGLASNGSPGNIHGDGGAFTWPGDSPTAPGSVLHFLYAGWLSGWKPAVTLDPVSPPTCYATACHPGGQGY